ncbi:MAG: hypothetical protein C0601_12065 [Candidatus Muiribacterium halophilum]|uniref:Tetratricopeptide repeat protein n=1 Tax=Muiribacterium halophilum TaxID=2053465 RepID=A0A2N5ZAW9_MUIH1|nr:MAG: hypothetical protein C0601_12065 [Candidatus Muirbacterium halophilum]
MKIIKGALTALFLVSILIFNISCNDNLSEYEQAKRFFRAGDYQNSEKMLKQIVKNEEAPSEAWFYLAVSYKKNNKIDKSIDIYDKITSPDFKSDFSTKKDFMKQLIDEKNTLKLEYAIELGRKGYIDKATELIVSVYGSHEWTLLYQGIIAVERKEYRKAEGLMQSAALARGQIGEKLDIDFSLKLHYYKSRLYYERYQVTREKDDLIQSFREIRIARNLLIASYKDNIFNERIENLTEQIKSEKLYKNLYGEIELRYDKLKIAERGNQPDEIISNAEFIYLNSPIIDDRFYACMKLGDAHLEKGDNDKAVNYYKTALQIAESIKDISVTEPEKRILKKLKDAGVDIEKHPKN